MGSTIPLHPSLPVTNFWGNCSLLDPQVVREREAPRLVRLVPLRQQCYYRLRHLLMDAREKGHTPRQVADWLLDRAGTDPEAALLLRDLWEVLNATRIRSWDQSGAISDVIRSLAEQVNDDPLTAGEEVLF